jgi:hypothetical protein
MISSKISAKPPRPPRPTCKVHGAAVVAVQVAIPSIPHRSPKPTSNTPISADRWT